LQNNKEATDGKRDFAAEGFLSNAVHYKTVFLQDAACLQDKYGALRIYHHPQLRSIFQHQEWVPFKERVLAAHRAPEEPFSLNAHLASALVGVEHQLVSECAVIRHDLKELKQAFSKLHDKVDGSTSKGSAILTKDFVLQLVATSIQAALSNTATRTTLGEGGDASTIDDATLHVEMQGVGVETTPGPMPVRAPKDSQGGHNSQLPAEASQGTTRWSSCSWLVIPPPWKKHGTSS
jgi:hypothetical protein